MCSKLLIKQQIRQVMPDRYLVEVADRLHPLGKTQLIFQQVFLGNITFHRRVINDLSNLIFDGK
jgi:hypothetical protein